MTTEKNLLSFQDAVQHVQELKRRVSSLIFGQDELISEVLCCLLSSGHVLITGAPGLAKTTLIRVISQNLGLQFGRIQFTPDLLPSDISGCEVLNIDPETQRRNFSFTPGPVFANFVLADEINRASPRTQSALLEAMQERRVTVAGKSYELPRPFMVFATQNPFESEGTFPLPEAQLDRFLMHALMSYPEEQAELHMLQEHAANTLVGELSSATSPSSAERRSAQSGGRRASDPKTVAPLSPELVSALIAKTLSVSIPEPILKVIKELVRSTRPGDPNCPDELATSLWYGAGPRAGISLVSVCRARALMEGREYVGWQDVRQLAKPVLRHRLRLTLAASRDRLSVDALIEKLLVRLEDHHGSAFISSSRTKSATEPA